MLDLSTSFFLSESLELALVLLSSDFLLLLLPFDLVDLVELSESESVSLVDLLSFFEPNIAARIEFPTFYNYVLASFSAYFSTSFTSSLTAS